MGWIMAEPTFGRSRAVRIFYIRKFSGNADTQSYSSDPDGEFYCLCRLENENWREKDVRVFN